MRGGVRQPVLPGGLPVVEECPRVAGDVLPAPPQIHVELVGVRGTLAEICATDERKTLRAAQDVDAAVGETCAVGSCAVGSWAVGRFARTYVCEVGLRRLSRRRSALQR